MRRIVLAYSGGLDTSIAIPWLAEKYHAEVVTVTMDLGQGKELEDARERALALGASQPFAAFGPRPIDARTDVGAIASPLDEADLLQVPGDGRLCGFDAAFM